MNDLLSHLTDRQLLELIYVIMAECLRELKDDNKLFSINLAADLLGTIFAVNKGIEGESRL